MSHKPLVWGIRLITLAAGVLLVVILTQTSPYSQEARQIVVKNVVFLNLSLFFFLAGWFTLMLFWLRRRTLRRHALRNLGIASRQGMLLALMAIGLLFLQSLRALTWWDGLILAGMILLVELYFLLR